jgi:hypothetical protein
MLNKQIIKLVLLGLLPIVIISAQNQNCINYTGGIGELETVFPEVTKFPYGKPKKLAIGLFDFNTTHPNLKVDLEIDKKVKTSGFGSQKISIIKKQGEIITSTIYFLANIPGANSSTSSPQGINQSSQNFYPKIGDKIIASLKLKTSPEIVNIKYQIKITARYYNEFNDSKDFLLSSFATSTALPNWTNINFSFTIPSFGSYQNIDTIFYRIEFNFPSSTASSSGIFWLDQMNFFVERNNNCLSWPSPLESSLKIFESYRYQYPRDFINNYRYNSAHLSSYYTDLIIKNYDPNYKNFFYLNLTPITKYFYPARKGWRIRPVVFGEFNQYIDVMKIVTSTGLCHEEMLPLYPNARYPEFLKLNLNNPNFYKLHVCLEESYMGAITNYTNTQLVDRYLRYLAYLDSYFPNPNLKYDAIFLDNFMPSKSEISKQTPEYSSIQKNFLELANVIHQKIGGLFKYFGNWGYSPYIDENNTSNINNFYLLKDMYNGYLDEGWLWSPYLLINNFLPDPVTTHLIFKTVIENNQYDYILLVGAFIEGNCTSTNQITSYVISSFYLVNNDNVYVSLRPISLTEGLKRSYEKPQCYDNSMYLPLGKPLKVKTIKEMIVTSTPNFTNGALYLRKYEKGLVLLNSSKNLTFEYQLSSHNQYTDQIGRTYNTPVVITLPPLSGLILYSQLQQE